MDQGFRLIAFELARVVWIPAKVAGLEFRPINSVELSEIVIKLRCLKDGVTVSEDEWNPLLSYLMK